MFLYFKKKKNLYSDIANENYGKAKSEQKFE